MNCPIDYVDDVTLTWQYRDEYGDESNANSINIQGLLFLGSSVTYQNDTYTEAIDAHLYLDPETLIATGSGFNLQGCYVMVRDLEGRPQTYKITRVELGLRKLLGGEVNNVHCFLSRIHRVWQDEL